MSTLILLASAPVLFAWAWLTVLLLTTRADARAELAVQTAMVDTLRASSRKLYLELQKPCPNCRWSPDSRDRGETPVARANRHLREAESGLLSGGHS